MRIDDLASELCALRQENRDLRIDLTLAASQVETILENGFREKVQRRVRYLRKEKRQPEMI